MDKLGFVEIRIRGSKGNVELTPDNFDIKEIMIILQNTEDLLFPTEKQDRPIISYRIEEGSVKHIFKTSIQFVIGFNALIGEIKQAQNIDFLLSPTAKAFENLQDVARKKDYNLTIKTSIENTNEIVINRITQFFRTEAIWAEAEFYFYGKVTNAGGKDKANIHLNTEEFGVVRIETPIPFLERHEENLLYRTFGIRVKGKQHSDSGEIDVSSLKFLELIEYQPKYDEDYLKKLRSKAKENWLKSINPDDWLKELRGGYDA